MRRNLRCIVSITTVAVSLSANAASVNFKDQFKDMAPPCSWTGFYAGLSAGNAWDSVRNSLSVVNSATSPYFASLAIPGVNSSGSVALNSSSMFEAFQVGYNYEMQEAVYGIELAYNNLSNSSQRGGSYLYTTNGDPYTLRNSSSANWLVSLRPRVGLAYKEALFYVNGGLSVAQFKYSQYFNESPFTPTPENPSFSQTRSGWNVGIGAEYRLACRWKLRAEYSFNRFSVNPTTGTLVAPTGSATFNNSLSRRDIHLFDLGVNYSFT